eukprot:INCI17224.2.p1 GENE.INCI17224.2~~INCI17224.2.p1  ORF type:complete len:969 (+),score=216.08 INCI17224.2:181-3087(+)
MPKTYPRYREEQSFGVIASPNSNVAAVPGASSLAICGALEDVIVWNVKTGQQLKRLKDDAQCLVTFVASQPSNKEVVAVGYDDGSIRVWNIVTGQVNMKLHGHKKKVTALSFNSNGSLLVSGADDTDIIVWDIVSQSGRFKLRGHKDSVTAVAFLDEDRKLLSSSKDTLLKIWDLDTQHAVATCVGHRSEVWSVAVNADQTRVVTGSSDQHLRVWALDAAAATLTYMGGIKRQSTARCALVCYNSTESLLGCQSTGKELEIFRVREAAEVARKMRRRQRRAREKRQSKQRKRKLEQDDSADGSDDDSNDGDSAANSDDEEVGNDAAQDSGSSGGQKALRNPSSSAVQASDELELATVVRTKKAMRSFAFAVAAPNAAAAAAKEGQLSSPTATAGEASTVLVSLVNNTLQQYALQEELEHGDTAADKKKKKKAAKAAIVVDRRWNYRRVNTLALPGHQSGVRALDVSSDDSLIASASSTAVKVWNVNRGQCVRTMDSGFGLCIKFLPGNHHLIVGTRAGTIDLYALGPGTMLQSYDAHEGAVWTVALRPDKRGFASGSADAKLKFWDFDLVKKPAIEGSAGASGAQLELTHTRTLTMTDEVLCVCYSNTTKEDELLICVALLDSTVKVFFDDTLKFFLSLYGHKLPVMAMDVSSDNSVLVTASADKNVKLWGLDFGDCHKSLFAHADSVMSVKFLPRTHYFFSVGKDGLVKYWDGDRFELILELKAHSADLWALTVSKNGDFLASAGNDKSVRIWARTDEMVFLEHEQELRAVERMRLEDVGDDSHGMNDAPGGAKGGDGTAIVESSAAVERSLDTVKAAERLMTSLDIVTEEEARVEMLRKTQEAAAKAGGRSSTMKIPKNPKLLGLTLPQFKLKMLRSVPSQELEPTLLTLSFHDVTRLFEWLLGLMEEGRDPELVVRCVVLLLKIHQKPIVANRALQEQIRRVRWLFLRRLGPREVPACIANFLAL